MGNDSDSDVNDILNDLLANDDAEENYELSPKKKERTLKELNFNFLDMPELNNENISDNIQEKSEIYDDTIDSSDDEDRRYFEEQKYSDYGRDIKSLLKKEAINTNEGKAREIGKKTFEFSAPKHKNVNVVTNNSVNTSKDIYCDEFFGLRIINPIVSSVELKARMADKIPITISRVKYHLNSEKIKKDWVIAGVLVNKSVPKTSQKGTFYSIWTISDLSENMNTVCLFMFSNANKTFWKTTIGTVIGILNPKVLESKDNISLATLSINNPQRIMILGKSKDMGKCKSRKKNGEQCNSIVNISRCEFCLYHIKQEYKKCSHRSELQAFSNTQNFSIDMLKKKTQQQTKLVMNNMPEFHAIVAVKNKKLEEKDAKRLALLSGSQKTSNLSSTNLDNVKNIAEKVEVPGKQMKKCFEEITKSRGWKATVLSKTFSDDNTSSSPTSKKLSSYKHDNIGKKDLGMLSSLSSSPRLGVGCLGGTVDLSEPITKKQINIAKHNAVKWVKENGKIKPKNPNKIHLSKEEKLKKGKKRSRESECDEEQKVKKPNVLGDKFKEMMQTKSAHTDLIEKSYEQEQNKYFNKLEMKERMEEKMLSTYQVPCKAVKCLTCKYTSFSASDMCKEQKHLLRIMDAVKRFFKCGDCGNRTVSLNRIPSHSCIKCSSSNWSRAAMMDERKTNISVTALSICGDEEPYLGSMTKDANLNLLVPEEDDK
ncbi:PREDICTED: protein MCM10 homolog [Eufriesea mexicana]|uniref:protein MCM10 homolog n=1 Tax=Eufriesea mexicana TaxID=516756 RepID=UPI00083BD7FA|nr:PREDICTED: protein MCM10 homolog [Eufriesea mexicana]